MKHSRTGRMVAAAAALAACIAVAAEPSYGRSDTSRAGGSVTIAITSDPGNLDPQRSVNGQNLLMSVFGYDTPVKLLNSGQLAPEVVTAWKAAKNSYTLTVRRGITCSDGSTLDAKTVAANINYVANSKNGAAMAGVAIPTGATATANAAKSTVTVTLPSSAPFFMQNIAELPLVCKKGLANRKVLAKATDGSGPYILSKAVPGDHYDYVLRKGYRWGPGGATTSAAAIPAKITFKVIASTTTTANLLLNGQVNIAQISGADTSRLKSLYSAGGWFMGHELVFNETQSEAAADPVVRRALVADLNLNALAKVDTGNLGRIADGLIASPKVCPGNTMTGNVPAYNPSAAATELTNGGWTVGSGGIRSKNGTQLAVSLIYANDEPTNSATAQYIAAQWKALGVNITLNEQSFDQDAAVVFGKGEWGATLIGLGVSNPSTLVPFFSGPSPSDNPSGNNFGHFNNAQYNALVAKASSKPGSAGCKDWNAAESALFRSADITPISNSPFLYWGKKTKFQVQAHVLIPTSIRVG
jgi:peptide/nickel transport system substrate-binding protein